MLASCYVLAFNKSAVEDKMKCLASSLALPHPLFSAAMDWILNLRQTLGVPYTLAEVGVDACAEEIGNGASAFAAEKTVSLYGAVTGSGGIGYSPGVPA